MAVRDPYEVLGVQREATQDEIKSAFRKLARQFHPDVNKDEGAEDKFKEIGEAYAILGDKDRRARFDQYGVTDDQGVGQNVDDMFTEAGFGDLFEAFFGGFGGARRRSRDRHGEDLRADALIELTDVLHGIEYRVDYRRLVRCGDCEGTGSEGGGQPETCTVCGGQGMVQRIQDTFLGQVRTSTTCPNCEGTGTVISNPCPSCGGRALKAEDANIAVKIPAGVENGSTVRVQGAGSDGVGRGGPGDLYLVVSVKEDARFRRDATTLHASLDVTFAQCVIGDNVSIEGLEGELELKIPPGTQPNDKLRIRGEGLPQLHGNKRGDLVVHVQVRIPKKVTEAQADLLRQFAELGDERIPQGESGGFLGGLFKKK